MPRLLPVASLLATLPFLSHAALAQDAPQVVACDHRTDTRFLADMMEPAGSPVFLMILSPPRNEIGERQCRLIEAAPRIGFYDADLAEAEAEYDPARGLVLTVPVARHDGTLHGAGYALTVTINQATGEVTATASE